MSANYIPSNLPAELGRDPNGITFPSAWPTAPWGAGGGPPEEPGVSWGRYFAALKRYKWLILLVLLGGSALGVGATRLVPPEYQTQGTIWISPAGSPRGAGAGPIQGGELLNPAAWVDLIRSPTITSKVVTDMSLYLYPKNPADQPVFAGFRPTPELRGGSFVLHTDASGAKYTLTTPKGQVLETGTVGDSIGRKFGFLWAPSAALLGPGRTIPFGVSNPTNIAAGLAGGLTVYLPERSSFMQVNLAGQSPTRTAAILNAIMREFVATAADLKRRNLAETEKTLGQQLDSAQRSLRQSEGALQSFQTKNITLPTAPPPVPNQASALGGSGGGNGGDAISGNYYAQQFQMESLQHDQQALTALLKNPKAISADAFMAIPSVQNAPDLQAALNTLSKQQAALGTARQLYTDKYRTVQDLQHTVDGLQQNIIPQLTRALIAQLGARIAGIRQQLGSTSQQLRGIPPRVMQQMRLERDVASQSSLYSMLQSRYEEAHLAETSAIPDVSILDTAIAPLLPTKNTAGRIILLAIAMSLGGAVGLALLLDHTDPRFRYPEQVTRELGLNILGAVPTITRSRHGETNPEDAAQVIEAFRSIRLAVRNAYDATGPIVFTVSSPGAGDGKSLVASNLALSFAEAGYRTVLIDGDTRRGQLHAMFAASRRPGLLDFLGGDVPLEAILRTTTHESLTLIPCGTRRHRGPELLHSQAMAQLIADLRARYDAVIVDSPPLGAGVDPFVLGSATGNMLVVLRRGATDRKMAEAKIKLLERLPIRVLGAVLNDIRAEGTYRYYSYLYGYTTSEDADVPRLSPRVGELTGQT